MVMMKYCHLYLIVILLCHFKVYKLQGSARSTTWKWDPTVRTVTTQILGARKLSGLEDCLAWCNSVTGCVYTSHDTSTNACKGYSSAYSTTTTLKSTEKIYKRKSVFSPDDCYDAGYIYDGMVHLCVNYVFENKRPHVEADKRCWENGARLVTIDTLDKYNFILMINSMFSAWVSGTAYVRIGGTFNSSDGIWRWVNGKPVNMSSYYWGPGQPSSSLYEPCLAMSTLHGYWNDVDCTEPLTYICQLDMA